MTVPSKPAIAALLFALGLTAAGCSAARSADAPAQGSQALSTLNTLAPAQPAAGCVSRPVAFAEAVMRLHTELMLTSLTCGEVYGDPALYERYLRFTVTHADLLRTAQRTLEEHLGGAGNGEQAFDTWRTRLANEEAQRLTDWDVARYCAARQSRFTSLIGAAPASFRAYAENVALRRIAGQGGC